VPQALRPVALIVRGERLPLTPWPEAVSEGMSRFERALQGRGDGRDRRFC
jgi:hypothetical protein